MEAAAAPPSLRPRRSLSTNPARAPRPGSIPRPWGLAAHRQGSAVRCELPRRPAPRLLRASATAEGGGDAAGAGRRKRLAVFVSGGGSNFRAIHEPALAGAVRGDVVALVTDKPEYARSNGIPVVVFPKSKSAPEGVSVPELLHTLREHEVDFVLLAGYLKLIPAELVREYPRSILNIHPSLLPAFGGKGYYGLKVHKAVVASGARYSGPTVHFVDEHYDTGKTLAQRVVPVFADDTPELLAARVLHEEHQVYVEAVAALCEDRIVWREDGVPLIKSRLNPDVYL
ncbi:phosphoribosylglycinamide formyltransferase, chloroplastic [Panicum miliaceum]|uniref:Phosphoribosylglycinamide formyltransferase, chloroplastic n=1 Tax=Panicum miliaceum TaxID=4540 RepID=A0A3L6Q6P5_PANMI|nr:phosphoribosylglycinamide formyltransferase, chloroplastic [Panicum miliaceum]